MKLGCFDLLNRLFPRLYISEEVHHEVVVSGVGLAGASEVAKAEWIEVKKLQDHKGLLAAREKYSLGDGELSTILLAKETQADVVLLDDFNARKLARTEGLLVRGSVGLLETFYMQGHLADLRVAFSATAAAQLYRPAVARYPVTSLGTSSALSCLHANKKRRMPWD